MREFVTSNGTTIPIIEGFRERIKPNWKSAFKPFEFSEMTLEKANKLKKDIQLASVFLGAHGVTIKDKDILDVGCYLGTQCIGAIEQGARSATGIDIPEYYVNQSTDPDVNASQVLSERRSQLINLHKDLDSSKIAFEDLSVFEMEYENQFDIIYSWETFEHITNPKEALIRIKKALKPGGVSFNLYNPFFCFSGGHSMCTLDFPFAHTLLSPDDFKSYVTQVKPSEVPENYVELCCNFFTKNLNRMTQTDLRNYIDEAGLTLLDFISVPELNLLNYIDNNLLTGVKRLYENATLNDLLCSYVYFIVKK